MAEGTLSRGLLIRVGQIKRWQVWSGVYVLATDELVLQAGMKASRGAEGPPCRLETPRAHQGRLERANMPLAGQGG